MTSRTGEVPGEVLGGLAGLVGVAMLGLSFAINRAPPAGASPAELARFAQQHRAPIL